MAILGRRLLSESRNNRTTQKRRRVLLCLYGRLNPEIAPDHPELLNVAIRYFGGKSCPVPPDQWDGLSPAHWLMLNSRGSPAAEPVAVRLVGHLEIGKTAQVRR